MNNDPKQTVLPDVGALWRLFLQSRADSRKSRRGTASRVKQNQSARAEKAEKKRRKVANASRARNRQYVQSRRTRRLKGSRHHS